MKATGTLDNSTDIDAIIDLATTMLCVIAASGDAEGAVAGMNKTLWTIIDRARAIRQRLTGEAE